MDVRFLDSLVVVAECGSIAEAARLLRLTAAGVSQRIHALEADIGVPLVVRSGRTVRLTAAGTAILDRARTIQRDVRDMKSIAAGGTLSGELRLGITPTLICSFAGDILCRFINAQPQIDLRVVRNNSTELYYKLINSEIDAAVTSHPPFAIPKVYEWSLLWEEPFVVLTPASMPERDPHDILATEPFLRLDRRVYAGQLIDDYLRKAGIRPIERLEIDGPEAIAILVDRGLGVTLLPNWAPPWPEGLKLRKLPLPDRSFKRLVGLLWLRAAPREPLIHAFLREARGPNHRAHRSQQRRPTTNGVRGTRP
jgi:DNA-binding transcriptional LysR family regulator